MDVREKLVEILVEPCGGLYPASELADYLIAHGVTVLPCNVGDKIYYINRYTGKIDEDTVKFLTITKNGAKPILTYHNIKFWDFYELGKTAFLTKNEAEASLLQPPKDENEPICCKDCEHLMFCDCYGECAEGHKGIVNPNDTCKHAKRKPPKGEWL